MPSRRSPRFYNVGQQIALRGRVILAAEQGQTHSAIAADLAGTGTSRR